MSLRLFCCLFLFYTLSAVGMEISSEIYNLARDWNYRSSSDIIRESLQGISEFNGHVPEQLWNKAKSEAKKTIPSGVELYHPDYIDRIFDTLPEVIDGVSQLISAFSGKNIACARIFVLLKTGGYSVHNIPYIFCSGNSINPKIPDDIRWLVRNIASYNFVPSSDQAFAHSERAFALSLLEGELSLQNFDHLYRSEDVGGWVIQLHNLNQEMCQCCKSFFRDESPYFVDVNETGYFVGKEYIAVYDKAFANWNGFMAFNIGRFKVKDLYSEYLGECDDDDDKRRAFHSVLQPHNFNEIIADFPRAPVVLFSHASPEYEECLIFRF